MKSIQVIIVDDERLAIEVIREMILHFAPDLVIAGTASNGQDAVQLITTLQPDLVFLDVDMPFVNGVEVMEKLPHQGISIVFTTGHETAEIKTKSNCVAGYLLKPIDPAEFVTVIENVRQRVTERKH